MIKTTEELLKENWGLRDQIKKLEIEHQKQITNLKIKLDKLTNKLWLDRKESNKCFQLQIKNIKQELINNSQVYDEIDDLYSGKIRAVSIGKIVEVFKEVK